MQLLHTELWIREAAGCYPSGNVGQLEACTISHVVPEQLLYSGNHYCPSAQQDADPRRYATYLATRPASFEQRAIHVLLDVMVEQPTAATKGFLLHIAHLGDGSSLEGLKV